MQFHFIKNELDNLKDLFHSLQCKVLQQKELMPRIAEQIDSFQRVSKVKKRVSYFLFYFKFATIYPN